jgi:hypothetical protein
MHRSGPTSIESVFGGEAGVLKPATIQEIDRAV